LTPVTALPGVGKTPILGPGRATLPAGAAAAAWEGIAYGAEAVGRDGALLVIPLVGVEAGCPTTGRLGGGGSEGG
jgi:hypothetical protein